MKKRKNQNSNVRLFKNRLALAHFRDPNSFCSFFDSSLPFCFFHFQVNKYKQQNEEVIKHTVGIKCRLSQSLSLLRSYQLRLKSAQSNQTIQSQSLSEQTQELKVSLFSLTPFFVLFSFPSFFVPLILLLLSVFDFSESS
jgi:hypothetical protein